MKEPNAFFDTEVNAAVGVFTGFMTADQFRYYFEELNLLRIQNESNKQINDGEQMKMFTKEVQNWLLEVWLPRAEVSGLEYLACVSPKDPLNKINMSSTYYRLKNSIEIKCFDSRKEANAWLMTK